MLYVLSAAVCYSLGFADLFTKKMDDFSLIIPNRSYNLRELF